MMKFLKVLKNYVICILLFLLEKFTKSTACPMTDTFFDLIGNEVVEAVTICSEIRKLKKSINFLKPNFGPGCVNQSVDLILFFSSNSNY